MSRKDRGSVGEGLKNWRRSDAPVAVKLGLVIKNNMKKGFTLKDCCGNFGEPGC
jgi:hypothetical protein